MFYQCLACLTLYNFSSLRQSPLAIVIINRVSLEAPNNRVVCFSLTAVPYSFSVVDNYTLKRVPKSTAGTVKMLMQQSNKYFMATSLAC